MKNVSKFKKPLLFISTLLAFVFSFSACCNHEEKVQTKVLTYKLPPHVSYYDNDLILIEIDSCQYFLGEWGNATVLTHKGNCSHCRSRSK